MNAKMPMAEAAKSENTTFSKKLRRSVFGMSLHSWEQLMLLSLGIAGLIAVAIFVTTASVVILQRHETAEAKRELEEYKLDAGAKISAAEAVGLTAQADIAKANAQIAIAKEGTAIALRDLERERTERLRQGPRDLKPEQAAKLTTALRDFPAKILVISTNTDESARYGSQIWKAVREAGVGLISMEYANDVPGEVTGLFVAEGRDDPAAIQLVSIMRAAEISVSPQMRKNFIKTWHESYGRTGIIPPYPYTDLAVIFVGYKPAINN